MGCQPLPQLCRLQQSRLPSHLLTVSEYDQGRNAADAEAPSQGLLCLGVELGEAHARLQLTSRLGEDRRHHLAGPAPGGPEVHHHRQLAALHQGTEVSLGQLDRLTSEEGGLALAAPRAICKARLANAVDSVAVRAAQGQGVGHGNLRIKGGRREYGARHRRLQAASRRAQAAPHAAGPGACYGRSTLRDFPRGMEWTHARTPGCCCACSAYWPPIATA